MTNLTRFHPLGELARSAPFGRLDEWFGNLENLMPANVWDPTPRIRMDLTEENNAYLLHAEIPGAKKDDIKVQVEGRRVTISAEVKQQTEQKEGQRVVHSERYYGRESRTIQLEHDVDEKQASAKYDNGVLALKLPILETSLGAHQLSIQ